MLSLFLSNRFNNIVLSTVLGFFTVTHAYPIGFPNQLYAENNPIILYEIASIMENVYGMENSNDTDRMYELIVKLKRHLETRFNIKISITKFMNILDNEIQCQGFKVQKKQLDAIKKLIKKKEKEITKKEKNSDFCTCYEDEEWEDDEWMYSVEKPQPKENEEKIYISSQLVFGVTLTLCGLFIMLLPIPACVNWGEQMVSSGVSVCGNFKVNGDAVNYQNGRFW